MYPTLFQMLGRKKLTEEAKFPALQEETDNKNDYNPYKYSLLNAMINAYCISSSSLFARTGK